MNEEERKEQRKNWDAKYYANNREKILESKKKYYEENKESILAKRKIYYQENKVEIEEKRQIKLMICENKHICFLDCGKCIYKDCKLPDWLCGYKDSESMHKARVKAFAREKKSRELKKKEVIK